MPCFKLTTEQRLKNAQGTTRGLCPSSELSAALGAAHLVDVVEFEVFEKEQEQGRDTLDDDLFVPVHIDAQLHALNHSDAATGRGGLSAEAAMTTYTRELNLRC